jgi:glucosamine--fructose-6-phosphate aminotransferase (isomerizing)
MCGIFGYVGNKEAKSILLEGLRTLEYRGYDSAGVFLSGNGPVKATGPIDNLANEMKQQIVGTSSTSGIAHTRWATHGEPSRDNAHPHCDYSENLWLVHNGIIENYQEIKSLLITAGVEFASETDSEVLAKLIGFRYEGNLLEAIKTALKEVEGAYAIAVMHKDNPDEIIVARLGSPIVLAKNTHGSFVSSDSSALLTHTKDVVYLEDGEIAVLKPNNFTVIDLFGDLKKFQTERLELDMSAVKKAGYEHFMLKEIHEAPEVIRNTIRGRLITKAGMVKLGGLETVKERVVNCSRLNIVGCGSAYLAGSVGKLLLEKYASIPVNVELASEYRYKANHHKPDEVLLAVSQSGETADTLAAIRKAKEDNLLTLGLVNVVGSSISRETQAGVYNHAGPEIAVASTKAFISELVVFVLLSVMFGRERGMSEQTAREILESLESLPTVIEGMLKDTNRIQQLAKKYAKYDNAIFIGRNTHAPIATEGSLKLKEVSYIHAEAYPGGELKHGPIALLDENFPIIALSPQNSVYDKMLSNIEEVKARKAPILAIATEGDNKITKLTEDVIEIPKVHDAVQPIVTVLPLHILAYYIGTEKGLNVDRPRNLAKSVTVE